MRYSEVLKIHSPRQIPVQQFLHTHPMVRHMAGEETPLEWLADEFLDADNDETFEDWLLRQARDVLNTALLADTMSGKSHLAKKVCNVEFGPEDRAYLLETLGRHPSVLQVWNRSVLPQERIAA